jgi:hypothetical protein
MTAAQSAGVVMAVPAGPGGAGGSFRVDPERAQACIDGLRAVALDLLEAQQQAKLMAFQPPAFDAVSLNLAVQGGKMARRAQDYVQAWRNQIIQTADALEQQLAAYRAAEEHNTARLT